MKRFFLTFGTTAALAVACCGGCKKGNDVGDNPANENGQTATASSSTDAGAAALDAGEWTRAYDAFSAAIAADPNAVDAYFGRAAASLAIAEERYRLAEAAATNGDVKTGTAEAEKANENFAKAIADCDKVLELDAKYADAYFIRGVAAQYQGDWNAGIEAFTKCVELSPENAEAYHRRGEIYDHTGDTEHATVDLKKAAELGYRDADGETETALQENAAESQTVEE
ncbi:MAG: tetratricopeptide repeat protein [Thermoguttaceae bacterium]|nr:tetratricopeptide repeat protein [Thermoguttaceae bacterium]